jgi:hypothetical protein
MSGESSSLPVYTITVGQSGTFTNDANVNIAPIVNAEIADAPAGYQIVINFNPGVYGMTNEPILLPSNTTVIGNNSTLEYLQSTGSQDNGAFFANADTYDAGSYIIIHNTNGTVMSVQPSTTNMYAADTEGTPIIDTNISVQGMTFNDTGTQGYVTNLYNNFGTWFTNCQNIDVQNNVYIGGTDGNAFVNVVNGIAANNIAVGTLNAAFDQWNGPTNITVADNLTFVGAPTAGWSWSTLMNATTTGDPQNPGNATNDVIVGNVFSSNNPTATSILVMSLLGSGINTISSVTEQGNVDSNLNTPNTLLTYAANPIQNLVVQDNELIGAVETSAWYRSPISINGQGNPGGWTIGSASSDSMIGNLIIGSSFGDNPLALFLNTGNSPLTANNAALSDGWIPPDPFSTNGYNGTATTEGNIVSSGTTTTGSGLEPTLDIQAIPTLFAPIGGATQVPDIVVSDLNVGATLSVTLTTQFGTLSLPTNSPGVDYTAVDGENGLILTGDLSQINQELSQVTFTSNSGGWDDTIAIQVEDSVGATAIRYIPVTVQNGSTQSNELLIIPPGLINPTVAEQTLYPGQTLSPVPNLSGDIAIAVSGENAITMANSISVAFLGSGSSTVFGGLNQEYIASGDGQAYLDLSEKGDITVAGGSGSMTVNAATGDDLIEVGSSNALITAGSGADCIIGGLGDFTVQGGTGPEYIASLPQDGGNMQIDLGSGNATVFALSGDDSIQSQIDTTNIIFLGLGDDSLSSSGNDLVFTGAGAISVSGAGGGSDTIYGGAGSLSFIGGPGTSYVDPAGSSSLFAGSGNLTVGSTGSFSIEISYLDGTNRTISLPGFSDGVYLTGYSTQPILTEVVSGGTIDAKLSDGTNLKISDPSGYGLVEITGNLAFDGVSLTAGTTFVNVSALTGISANGTVDIEGTLNQDLASLGLAGKASLLMSTGSYDINGYDDVIEGSQIISLLLANQTIATQAGTSNIFYADLGDDQIDSSGDDVIFAGSGDTVDASVGGSDTVYGGSGDVTFIGGSGSSFILPSDLTSIEAGSGNLDILGGGSFSLEINAETASTRTITLPDLSAGVQLLGFAAQAIEVQKFNGTTLQVILSDGTVLNLADQKGFSVEETSGQLVFSSNTLAAGSTLLEANASYHVSSGSGVISTSGGNQVVASGTSFSVFIGIAGQDHVALLSTIGAVTTSGGANTILIAGNSDTVVSNSADDFVVSTAAQAVITVSGFANIVENSGSATITAIGSGCVNALAGTGRASEIDFINASSDASTVTGLNGSITVFGGAGGGYYRGGALGNNSLIGGTGLVTLVGSSKGGDTLVASGSVNGAGFNTLDAGLPASSGAVTTGGNDVLQSTSASGTTYFNLNAGNDQVTASGGGIQYINFNPIGEATVVGSNAAVMNQFYLNQSAGEGGTTDMISNFDLARDNFLLNGTSNPTISSVANSQNFGGGLSGAVISLSNGSTIELVSVSFTKNQIASVIGTKSF